MRSVAELSLVALRFPTNASLPATTILPLSAEAIRERAPKVVAKPETMNFRTMLPEPGGMYDPKLFGPGTVVDAPPVPLDAPYVPRKTQFARIPLTVPILHPLFAQHLRSEVAALLGDHDHDVLHAITSLEPGRKLVAALAASATAASLVMYELPILPPDLRPLRMTEDLTWTTSPLNEAYRRVINRNDRLAKLLELGEPEGITDHEYNELREAILRLFENDEHPDPVCDNAGIPMPSLRSLCGGTLELYRALQALEQHRAGEPLTGRLHLARMTMFAMGFDVRGPA